MKLSQFVDLFAAALYNEMQLTGRSNFTIGEITEKYGLKLNPAWRESLFNDYTFKTHVEVVRHLGPTEQQHVSLSSDGFRWVEDELDENVAEFLERNGATYAPENANKLRETAQAAASGPFDPEIFDPAIFDTGEPISSSSWTGLPRAGTLSVEAAERLKVALKVADDAVAKASCSNEERAQARAYILAIHALAEAPDPPADLIWKLIERANSVAGIASFFISLVALFANA